MSVTLFSMLVLRFHVYKINNQDNFKFRYLKKLQNHLIFIFNSKKCALFLSLFDFLMNKIAFKKIKKKSLLKIFVLHTLYYRCIARVLFGAPFRKERKSLYQKNYWQNFITLFFLKKYSGPAYEHFYQRPWLDNFFDKEV